MAWNRQSSNALASAHVDEVWLWDTRRPSGPQIFGRGSGGGGGVIQSLDWNPSIESEIVTSRYVWMCRVQYMKLSILTIVFRPIIQ